MLAKEQLLKKMESSLTALSSKQMDLEASQAKLETKMVLAAPTATTKQRGE